MTSRAAAITRAIESRERHADGRRERSRNSRRKILQAMLELQLEGVVDPSAASVAERAGVGIRTVFRHFDDKESIYRELNRILVDLYGPELGKPYRSEDWRDQLFELVERRARVYEAIAPVRISASVLRFRSPALMENYSELLEGERSALEAILPPAVKRQRNRARAIALVSGFDTWRMLRQDEELSAKKTVAAIRELLEDVLSGVGD
jgi:AcrR family transcriptional regulator